MEKLKKFQVLKNLLVFMIKLNKVLKVLEKLVVYMINLKDLFEVRRQADIMFREKTYQEKTGAEQDMMNFLIWKIGRRKIEVNMRMVPILKEYMVMQRPVIDLQ